MPVPSSTHRLPVRRFVIYGLLYTMGTIFLLPLIWLFLTAVKPLEQTTQLPPTFLPRAYYAEIDGESVEVTRDYRISDPTLVVARGDGARTLVPASSYDPDHGTVSLGPSTRVPVTVLAEAQAGDWRVSERAQTFAATGRRPWAVVPAEEIETRIHPHWGNFRLALATIGGKSIEEAEGTVDTIEGGGPDSDVSFLRFLANTLLVCVLGVIGAVFSNAVIAYAFARLRWPGRDWVFGLTLATMMVPFPVLMVPLYAVFRELGWIGTLLPLWVPAWFGSAFNIFLIRQFFRTIPGELSEAARIDGASEWQVFWRVILPLSKPVLATVALFHFLHAWNDFMGPLLYLTKRSTFTLALALQNYQTQNGGTPWNFLMAASAVVILPVIILFFFTQKTFIRGIATTGMKG